MDTQYRKNLKAVLTASKNYTDKTKEEIYWHIGDYSVSTQADNTTASTKTVPTGATRCKIKRIYGLTEKFNPSIAYDDASTMTKTMPNTVYDFDCSIVYGNSEVSENLCPTATYNDIMNNTIAKSIDLGNLPYGTYTISFNVSVNSGNRIFYIYRFNNGVLDTVNFFDTQLRGTGQKSYTFTLDGTIPYEDIRLGINTSSNDYSITLDSLMLNKGSTALPYSPYFANIHNLELSGLKVEGANIFDNANTTLVNSTFNASDQALFSYGGFALKVFNLTIGQTYTITSTKTMLLGETNDLTNSGTVSNGTSYTFTATTNYLLITNYAPNEYTDMFANIMLNYGSTALTFVPYIAPTTKTIDLSTILYNGSPLFEGNSLKGVGTAKDYITPYVAHRQMEKYTITGNEVWTKSNNYYYIRGLIAKAPSSSNVAGNIIADFAETTNGYDLYMNEKSGVAISSGGYVGIGSVDYENRANLVGKTIIYELSTPIEVSIDWSSTLRGIQGYSNGTITLQNTYNMDTANTITYNSIIKENCCAKIVQSRGGSVVKTINLTNDDVEYGYSSTNENNVRDYTTNVGTINVGKRAYQSGDESDTDVITDMEYTYYPLTTPTTETLTAIENVIEVEPNDTIAFLDENDNAVNVPSDLTYRIEVERV